jgi:hypothetical protein
MLMIMARFSKGSFLSVKVILYNKSEQALTGLCIKRTNKGLNSSSTIKYFVNNE